MDPTSLKYLPFPPEIINLVMQFLIPNYQIRNQADDDEYDFDFSQAKANYETYSGILDYLDFKYRDLMVNDVLYSHYEVDSNHLSEFELLMNQKELYVRARCDDEACVLLYVAHALIDQYPELIENLFEDEKEEDGGEVSYASNIRVFNKIIKTWKSSLNTGSSPMFVTSPELTKEINEARAKIKFLDGSSLITIATLHYGIYFLSNRL